ncbi:Copper chaperone CopZ [Actinopolyspora xinjiangensis]|uniref:Copper chaperone CopZ n=1 Tax=Actinopolyspora xinjiangensis TaxID=405564 RepID=A0A1H0S6H2_9ACTN|nr:heavy metal-associated domain-containing protein [Actinopolyspora xinjiangensis]SDP37139.1 Copper chaperone CopZ [Actinopolyspora xinjiangensis]
MSTSVYTVKGMTCSGCMNKVSTAVNGVEGVEDVDIDISTGQLTVTGRDSLDAGSVRQAVQNAGYEVVS